jgi:beta-lactamase class A
MKDWITQLVVLVLCAASALAQSDSKKLEAELAKIRGSFRGDMAIYMKNVKTGQELAFDADRVYETFSVIKIPIMVEVLGQAEAGKFSLTDRYELKAGDARWPSGVLYTLEPGLKPTIKDLLTLMIIISDNVATDILADKVGRDNVTRTMHSLGLKNTEIRFSDVDWDRVWLGHLDPKFRKSSNEEVMTFPFGKYSDAEVREAFRKAIYKSNIFFGHSTARETGRLLELLAQKKLVSEKASGLMLDILEKQQVDNRFPRYLQDIRIAHKTGDGQPFIGNDAGILFVGDQPIVLVVFTGRHRGSTAELHDAVARVAAHVAQYFGGKVTAEFGAKNRSRSAPAVD